MASTYEIIQGIHQAAANAYDGATEEDGKPKLKLKRSEGNIMTDKRVMDGFGANVVNGKLLLTYHTECRVEDIHGVGMDKYLHELKMMLKELVSYLKKEYKKVTKQTLTLTKEGEEEVLIEPISKIRTSVRATCVYKIGGLKEEKEDHRDAEDYMKNFYATLKKESLDKKIKYRSHVRRDV